MAKPLWAPWRLEYIEQADEQAECVFCREAAGDLAEADSLVVARGELAFAILNKFPYSSGHLLLAPLRHEGTLEGLTDAEALELPALRRGDRGARARLRAGRLQSGLEPGPRRGSGDHRACPSPRRPALVGRHELHARARGRQGAAGAPARD